MLMVDLEINDKIVDLIRMQGPVLPVKITKLMDTNILFASAKLSELVDKKIVKISTAKIGGSPVYYLSGQESKLEMLYKYLPEKEKEAYNLLKEKKVLKDINCEPGIRVAFRSIKDFAVAFQINNEFFWKWHLASNDEVVSLMKNLTEVPKEEKQEKLKVVEEIKPKIKEKKDVKPKIKVEKPKKLKIKKSKPDEFLLKVNNYVSKQNYDVLEALEGKKNKEVYKTIEITSDLGKLKYMLFARNKKKISDSDLRLAYSKAQEKKIPVLFLSNGELSKKAEKFLESNSLVIFKRI